MLDVFEVKKCCRFCCSCVYQRRKSTKCNIFLPVFKTLNKCPKQNRDVCHQFQQTLQMRTLISGFHYIKPWKWCSLISIFFVVVVETELHNLGKTVTKQFMGLFICSFLNIFRGLVRIFLTYSLKDIIIFFRWTKI